MPVQAPSKYQLVINLNAGERRGVSQPDEGRRSMSAFAVALGERHQHADTPHALGLLCAGG
jgi:hypothetical protein